MGTKLILLNAPPSAGKDTFADYIYATHADCVKHLKFTTLLVEHTKDAMSIPTKKWDEWYVTGEKEVPRKELNGMSARQALYHTSKFYKEKYGEDYFAIAAAKAAKKYKDYFKDRDNTSIIFSDVGFDVEIPPMLKVFRPEDVWIVRIQSDGCSFDNDVRKWLYNEDIPDNHYITINNDKTDIFFEVISSTYDWIMEVGRSDWLAAHDI